MPKNIRPDQSPAAPFHEDPRYRQCNKEALLGLGLGLLNLLWWWGWGYGLGSRTPSNYTFVFGFPLWFFMSCIAGAIVFTLLAAFLVNRFFQDMPLETSPDVLKAISDAACTGKEK